MKNVKSGRSFRIAFSSLHNCANQAIISTSVNARGAFLAPISIRSTSQTEFEVNAP